MPLFHRLNPGKDTHIALWHITETHEVLRAMLPGLDLEHFVYETRNLHWLAARMALYTLTGLDPTAIVKDEQGKPHLKSNQAFISLTHSGAFAAAAISDQPVGIDLEHIHPRLLRVREKYVSEQEKPLVTGEGELEKLAKVWSAKESLYKIFGDEAVHFKEQQVVTAISPASVLVHLPLLAPPRTITVNVLIPDPDYVLTWALV